MSTTWVDKYKPKSSSELAGQGRNVARIKSWLKTFEPSKCRPLFIYGPPGIGKTTAAHICCRETGFEVVEFNASDQRNKNIIREIISTISDNSRLSFTKRASDTKDAIILDEIDGMAGNEDRGGIGQLIQEIKTSKKPMIFICNDGQHQKLRSLKDKCEVIEFKRPEYETIRAVVGRIASKENLDMDKINVRNLAEASDFDIRQILNSLSLFKGSDSSQLVKTTRMNAFEATKKVLTASSKHSIENRFECFFSDYNIMPLFIFENYAKNKPARGDHLLQVSRAADCLCLSDLAEKEIRSNQNWSLLNAQALLSTVVTSKFVESNMFGRVDFPQFLGKLSNVNKRMRLTQELNAHMCLSLRGELDVDYLEVFSNRLSCALARKDIDSAVDFMYDYSLLRDDFNSIMELASWSDKPDPMAKVDTKTKTAFTNAYKKRSVALPYFSEDSKVVKKRKHVDLITGEESEVDDEEEGEEAPRIAPKRVIKNEKSAPVKEKKAPKGKSSKNGSNSSTQTTTASEDSQKSNGKVDSDQSKADKRPPSNGIARFFTAKKQKS